MKRPFLFLLSVLMVLSACSSHKTPFRIAAWLSGNLEMTEDQLDAYFSNAARAGITSIYLECHNGYPPILGDSTSFRDSAALLILRRAVPVAHKYGLELHA